MFSAICDCDNSAVSRQSRTSHVALRTASFPFQYIIAYRRSQSIFLLWSVNDLGIKLKWKAKQSILKHSLLPAIKCIIITVNCWLKTKCSIVNSVVRGCATKFSRRTAENAVTVTTHISLVYSESPNHSLRLCIRCMWICVHHRCSFAQIYSKHVQQAHFRKTIRRIVWR